MTSVKLRETQLEPDHTAGFLWPPALWLPVAVFSLLQLLFLPLPRVQTVQMLFLFLYSYET